MRPKLDDARYQTHPLELELRFERRIHLLATEQIGVVSEGSANYDTSIPHPITATSRVFHIRWDGLVNYLSRWCISFPFFFCMRACSCFAPAQTHLIVSPLPHDLPTAAGAYTYRSGDVSRVYRCFTQKWGVHRGWEDSHRVYCTIFCYSTKSHLPRIFLP